MKFYLHIIYFRTPEVVIFYVIAPNSLGLGTDTVVSIVKQLVINGFD